MNYEDFQAKFIKENRKLRVLVALSTVCFIFVASVILMDQRYFIYNGHPIFEERILSEKICLEGFKSITSGNPDKNTVTSGIFDILRKDPFLVEINKILVLKSLETSFCKLVVETKKGLRSFKIGLEGEDENPFFYKILSITELAVEEES